uniref:Uncharacterized protein n=1 Tax=Rhizophora mucronata TaxID=61149 RepID=A0A2P2PGZ6_RHIMU
MCFNLQTNNNNVKSAYCNLPKCTCLAFAV